MISPSVEAAAVAAVIESGMFDAVWYLETYSDVAKAGMHPLEHYMVHGWLEGRDPNPEFDSQEYVETHMRGDRFMAPLLHHLKFSGWY